MAVTSSSSAPTVDNATRWPAYTTKADVLRDLEHAAGGGPSLVADIAKRLSATDTTALTDKGSRVT